MTTTIDIRDLSTRLDEALLKVAAGGEVILADGPTPRARIVPLTGPHRSAGLHVGAITVAADFDAPLADNFWTGQP